MLFLGLDDTLLDRARAFRTWAQEFLDAVSAPDADLDWLVSIDADGMTSRWDIAEAARDRYGLRASTIDLVESMRDAEVDLARLDPLVACSLGIAGDAGWVPVIVTNGESHVQEAKIKRSGLDRWVADWVISEEAGVRKPNPRIFSIAAERIRMNVRNSWVIGDGPESDIAGAAALGVPSVWLHRGRTWSESRFGPEVIADGMIPAIAAVLST
jgi:putative hydrolase of the HAD superfamily